MMSDRLNEEQKAAVESNHKKILCHAGAGTGKTKTLTERVARLVRDGTPPEAIVALTFTRAAGSEMRERLGQLLDTEKVGIFCDTFHTYASKLLRENAGLFDLKPDFEILSPEEHEYLWGVSVESLGKKVFTIANKAKQGKALTKSEQKDFERAKKEYKFRLRQRNAIDFDHLIIYTKELLENEAGKNHKGKVKHLLVDEFQDTDQDQWAIINLIEPENTFLVGDDNQSIYGFRGSDPAIMWSLMTDDGWEILRLTENYRSTEEIVITANTLLLFSKLQNRSLKAHRHGPPTAYAELLTEQEEAKWVCEDIIKHGIDSTAIIARTNAKLDWCESHLQTIGMPYKRLVAGEQNKTAEKGMITLSTIHGVKGLEFKNVYIVGVTKVRQQANTPEELRILYVGITRAEERLTLTRPLNILAWDHEEETTINQFVESHLVKKDELERSD